MKNLTTTRFLALTLAGPLGCTLDDEPLPATPDGDTSGEDGSGTSKDDRDGDDGDRDDDDGSPDAPPAPDLDIPDNPKTLLSSYVPRPTYGDDWLHLRYQPRQFVPGTDTDLAEPGSIVDDPGPYHAWDVLNAPSQGVHRSMSRQDWLTLELERPARVAIVWRGGEGRPDWLDAFTPGEAVGIGGHSYPTFVMDVPAGELVLGGVMDPGESGDRLPYLVLFAEEGGVPSPDPEQPEGVPPALPNQTCPQWVHDQYVAPGPDGNLYRTWHRPIDPVFWCYFHHEHGSDPARFVGDARPLFGYTAPGQSHEGFKVYVMEDGVGYDWMFTHHFGTGSITRACMRFHTTDAVVASQASGEIVAEFHLLGDYGGSEVNVTQDKIVPSACPEVADITGTFGVKKLPTQETGSIGYEPWRIDGAGIITGYRPGGFTVNTHDPQTICNDTFCDSPIFTENPGTNRTWAGYPGVSEGAHTGEFYTDPYGLELRSATDPDAKRQYVKPGIGTLQFPDRDDNLNGVYTDPWGGRIVQVLNGDPLHHELGLRNLEGSIRRPN